MNIKSRRYGYTKALWDEIEVAHKENPDAVIIGWCCPYPRHKSSYDADKRVRTYFNGDPDDFWYIPVEWIMNNQEKYLELIENRRKALESWNKVFNIKPLDIKGKQIFTTWTENDKVSEMYRNLWNDGEKSETGLKRFFIPAYKKEIDEYGNEQ